MSLRILYGILIVGLLLAEKPQTHAPKAQDSLIQRAIQAEQAGDFRGAYILWAQASVRQPELWAKAKALEHSLDIVAAAASVEVEPDLPSEAISNKDLEEAKQFSEPTRLTPVPGQHSFHIHGNIKALYEEIAKKFGYVAVLEGDLATQTQQIRFDIDYATYEQVLHTAEVATNTFLVPISDKVMIVAVDTTAKRNELEPNVSAVFLIPQRTSVQEATEIMMTVQQTLEMRRSVLDPGKRLILVRGPQTKVNAARMLLSQLSSQKTEVGIELELLTFDENKSRSWGLGLQTSSTLVNFGKAIAHVAFSNPASITNFLTFGGGATFLGLGITGASLFANATNGEATSMMRSELVVLDGQTANFHVGEKYPIVTSQYSGSTTTGVNVSTGIPAFTYEDLGLALKVTPWVHGQDEMTLEIEAEFKSIGGSGINGIPIIKNRKFQSKLRVNTSEWALISGLVSRSDLRTISGIPGLSSLPIVGSVLNNTKTTHDFSEALILIKPRILSMPPSERVTTPFWIGTETKPRTIL